MLLIKLKVDQIRLIERANTEAELRGVRQMMLDQIKVSETLKEFGKEPSVKRESLGWAKAYAICEEVLGQGSLTRPPYPDNSWYARIGGVIRRECMTEETVRELAEYARDHLRQPTSFDFLICQQHRIRSGEFNVVKRREGTGPLGVELPRLPEPEGD